MGYSIGNWTDADASGRFNTLEVETRLLKGPRAYDFSGIPLHEDNQTVVKERIFLDKANPNLLHDEITTFDHALTHPWKVDKKYVRESRPVVWFEVDLLGRQRACADRQAELHDERRRLPDAGQEGAAAAGLAILQAIAEVGPARSKRMAGIVTAVSCSGAHTFTKPNTGAIRLVPGLGVEGDAHLGVTVKHRTLVRSDPTRPNLRQVHLMHAELHEELRAAGFPVEAGQIGENVTTRGIALLCLPTGTRLHLGAAAVVEVTGLRNPCRQLDAYQAGLTAALLGRDENGNLIRKAGIMSIVLAGGEIRPGDAIGIELPPEPHRPLERV